MPYPILPSKVFFVTGAGQHTEQLASFELALRNAGIERYNLVSVSSILPKDCAVLPAEEGLKELHSHPDGSILHVVMARCQVNEQCRLASAAIGLAYPKDKSHYGYLSEVHEPGMELFETKEYAEDLAVWMLVTCQGVQIEEKDLDKAWNERKEVWKVEGREYESDAWGIACPCPPRKWTAVVAAAVLLP